MTYDTTTRAAGRAYALDADFYDLASVEGVRGLEGAGDGEEVSRPLGLVAFGPKRRAGKTAPNLENQSLLSHSRLLEMVSYDAETGYLIRRVAGGGTKPGDVFKTRHAAGYIQTCLDGRRFLAHRLVWFYVTGEWPRGYIDHMDGDRSNNRFSNLRDVSVRTNAENVRKPRKDNVLGIIGVSLYKRTGTYRAVITVDGVVLSLGYYKTAEEAGRVYLEAKRKFHVGCTI